ncbi:hypothetical protein AUR04nite_29410 [Glutamicibacter uratoxydans]|uniref:Uncharacterized protein n=1 Tax=Glutamicibacter uratoxydans TaxID=43667 RepID=A0A4Y4DPX9_GLUUR|nr:hypothetical protein [Glutamicibacter uratoxydans]GED07409.1 hypothetical protein AUR04nite_29410 [Glutamicibacter uratoxydans]
MALDLPRQSQFFVDECKAKGYYLVATIATSASLNVIRTELKAGRHRGTDYVHFVRERDAVRNRFIDIMLDCQLTSIIYASSANRHVLARESCIHAMLDDIVAEGIRALTIESDASIDAADRRIIAKRLKELRYADLRYVHRGKKEEPLLWASDAIAWCYNREGNWRKKITPLILDVRSC